MCAPWPLGPPVQGPQCSSRLRFDFLRKRFSSKRNLSSVQSHPENRPSSPPPTRFHPVQGGGGAVREGTHGAEGATSKGTSALKRFFQCGFETTVPAPCFPSLVSLMVCLHAQHTGRLCSAFSPAPLPGIPAVGGRVGGGLPVGLRASASSPPQLGETDIKDCILSAPAPSLSFPGGAAAPALSCCCIKWVQVTTVHPGLCSSLLTLHSSQKDSVPSDSLYSPPRQH